MELSRELAQKIVDRTSQIVDYIINVMDTNGIIIASNDKSRIGEHHEGAKKVLSTLQPHVIDEKEAANYPHVVPGISLPITFHNEILGVIGIGSSSQSALTYGHFMQLTAELILEQEFLKEKMMNEGHARNKFLRRLLQFPWLGDEEYFLQQSALHNLDIDQPYLIAAVEIEELSVVSHTDLYDSAISRQERMVHLLIHTLSQSLPYPGLQIISMANDIAFMLPLPKESEKDPGMIVNTFSKDLDRCLSQQLQCRHWIGIGGIASDLKDVNRQYRHAYAALLIGDLFGSRKRLTRFIDVYPEYMFLSLPKTIRNKFYHRILDPLLENSDKQEQWLTTLTAFFDNNKSLVATADALFIHRNSLLFRLNRIHKLTGFHPQNHRDSLYLSIALIFYRMDHTDKPLNELINLEGVIDEL